MLLSRRRFPTVPSKSRPEPFSSKRLDILIVGREAWGVGREALNPSSRSTLHD